MNKVHLIGNAHLDPVWLWQWQEGFAEIKATFKSALDRMREYEDFKFTSACSAYYMWIEKCDKKMFDEIAMRVREGRWNIVGAQFIQPDCNLPSGESFARHSLISQRYFIEKFGITVHTGYNVDSFGHNGNLPQILKKSGIDNYVFMRPMPYEKELPAYLFNWQSMDGSSVLTYRIPEFYNIDLSRMQIFDNVEKLADKHDMMAFYGVGNHGGGATVELLDKMHETLSDNFVYSTPDEFFDSVKSLDVPTVCDDLQFHAKGCYSAVSQIKENNRLCENKLFCAEEYSVLSNTLLGTPYPTDELDRAWKNVLFNQFHDILGGCSIKEAYTDAAYVHGEALAIADRNINFALGQIAWNIDTIGDFDLGSKTSISEETAEKIGTPIVVFNPLSHEVNTVVSVRKVATKVTDFDGNEVPMQLVRDSKTNLDQNDKTAFSAVIPPLGYAVYKLHAAGEKKEYKSSLCASDTHLENDFISIDFDESTGEIASFKNKQTGEEILCGSFAFLVDETPCDTWAHDIKEFKDVCAVCKSGKTHLIENGGLLATIRSEQKFENTHIIRDYTLSCNDKKVSVKTKILFLEKHKMLKFSFKLNSSQTKAFGKIPYGFIERPTDGSEQPSGDWIAMTGECGGIGVATSSKYSFDADKNVLSLTILRGAIFADHYGVRDERCEYSEQGEHTFTYSIAPFDSFADCENQAQELGNEPFVIADTFHRGELSQSYSGISVSEKNIIVTAVKKHEDSNAIVLRCYEGNNCPTKAHIKLFGCEFDAEFTPNEIKTFIVSGNTVTETNFIEEEI